MKKQASNKALFDKNRFKVLEKEKTQFLETLTIEESTRIFESLTSKESLAEFFHCFADSSPLCLKLGLKNDIIKRSI